jgi:hypothetical protein
MKILNILGFAAFLFVFAETVSAHPMEPDQCLAFARDSYTVSLMRDAGVDIKEVQAQLVAFIKELPPGSYIKDEADVLMVAHMIEEVYESPQNSMVVAEQEYNACIKNVKDHEV